MTLSLPVFPLQTLAAFDWSRFAVGLTVVGFGAVCVLLVLAILIQKPQGGGLSGAFGAGASGSGQTAFGTKTGDALTWMTIIIFLVYLGAAIGMNYAMRPADNTITPPAAAAPPGSKGAPAEKPAEPPAKTPESNVVIPVKPPEAPATTPPANAPATTPTTIPPTSNPPAAPPATPPSPR